MALLKSVSLSPSEQRLFANARLEYKYGEEHHSLTASQLLEPRGYEDRKTDIWNTFKWVQESLFRDIFPRKRKPGGVAG
jgi:hypothetical protein